MMIWMKIWRRWMVTVKPAELASAEESPSLEKAFLFSLINLMRMIMNIVMLTMCRSLSR